MTDPELIQLLQDKAPEELSFEEIELLRKRLRHSAELRETLLGQLQMEEYISQALGRVAVSVDEIYSAVNARGDATRQRIFALLGWTASLGLGIVVLLWLALANSDKPPRADPAAADDDVPRIAALEPQGGNSGQRDDLKSNPPAEPASDATAGAVPPTEKPDRDPEPGPAVVGRAPAAQPAAAAPAAEQPAADEWPELNPKAPRRPFVEAAIEDADGPLRGISKNQLSRWFAPVAGQNHGFTETNRGNVVVAGFDGLIRLRAPWPADAVLSFAPFDHHSLAIYFWNGTHGVSLHYYQHPRPNWAAYRTTRKGTEPRPATFALAATDNDRYDRTLAGAITIRHQEGTLVVSRGDLRLVTVPLEVPPTEVYFDKHAWLRAFTMYRSEPVPDDTLPSEQSVLAKAAPDALEWTKQLANGVHFNKAGDGAMQLVADKSADLSWAAVKLPRPGLFEIAFRLGETSPGTGVFLGDDSGKPLYVLGFVRDQRTGQNVAGFLPPNAGSFETNLDLHQQPVPYVGSGQWLRLVAGSGTLKCWTSGDGKHWSRAMDPARGLRGGWSHVGLISFKTNDPHRITLEHLRVSELGAISSLADDKLRQQVSASVLTADPNPAAWQARVQESLPAGADVAAWRNACAFRTLAALPHGNLGNPLLNGLLEENLTRQASAADRLRVLSQAAELYDAWEQPESYRLSQFYERLGKRLLREGDREPWSKAGRALLTASLWTTAQFQTIPESLVTAELLFRIYADQWEEVRDLCRRIKFLNRPAIPEQSWPDNRQRLRTLVEWAGANAERVVADKHRKNGNGPAAVAFNWQHPLSVSLSKEGYNTLAELEALAG
jgi:hypothetical protein